MKKIVCLLLICLFLSGCRSSNEPLTKEGFYFDTVIQISLYDQEDPGILDECFAICHHYEQLLSKTADGSDVSRINQAKGKPVVVSNDTKELIQKALDYSEMSGGAFDITIAPLTELWDFKEKKEIPPTEKIAAARELVDYHTVSIEGNAVTLQNPDAAIDLGAVAKGFIADKLKTYLRSAGVKSAVINLGGNVLTVGGRPDGSDWNIGIQKPFDESNGTAASVRINDGSVVTSGVYQRYFEKGGTVYHHLLDPKTGYPFQNGLLSVTILSDNSVDGDALSTTCFALGLEEGMRLVGRLPDVEAIFIDSDYQLHDSRIKGDGVF